MDLLITVIGNAVLDPVFRARLLEDPVQAIDTWQFRLTKSEMAVLEDMFSRLSAKQLDELNDKFESVATMLYLNRDEAPTRGVLSLCPTRRCSASVYPVDQELRDDLRKAALEESKKAVA